MAIYQVWRPLLTLDPHVPRLGTIARIALLFSKLTNHCTHLRVVYQAGGHVRPTLGTIAHIRPCLRTSHKIPPPLKCGQTPPKDKKRRSKSGGHLSFIWGEVIVIVTCYRETKTTLPEGNFAVMTWMSMSRSHPDWRRQGEATMKWPTTWFPRLWKRHIDVSHRGLVREPSLFILLHSKKLLTGGSSSGGS